MDRTTMNQLIQALGLDPSAIKVMGVDCIEINIGSELTVEQMEERISEVVKITKASMKVPFDMPLSEPPVMPTEFGGFKKGEYNLPDLFPEDSVYVSGYRSLLSNRESGIFDKIAKGIEESTKKVPDNVLYCNFRKGYVETSSGRRRNLRRKSTLDNNNPLR